MYSLIIVDDEIIEQRVLQKMVVKFCPFVRMLPCASNGAELLKLLEVHQPDIIVLDINMPILNGLDVLEILKAKKSPSKILMISAYSKFQYAQKAVNMGADGYILKPVNEIAFAEAIQKLCMEMENERKESNERRNLENLQLEYKKILENEIISDVLLGEINPESMKKYIASFAHFFCGGGTCVVKKDVRREQTDDQEMERILIQLNRLCTCFWKKYKDFYAICFLPDSDEQKVHYERWVRELFEYVRKMIPSPIWDSLIFGISSWKDFFEEFPTAMWESRVAVQGICQEGFYTYCEPQEREEDYSFHKEFYECRCRVNMNAEEEKSRGQYMFCKIWKKKQDLELIRIFAFALRCAGKRNINEKIVFSGAYDRLGDWGTLNKLDTVEDIWSFASAFDQGQKQQKSQKEENIHVGKCIRYLECHYSERISLESVAEVMGISIFYLSRLFKQEMGRTFTEVLTDIRILAALDRMWRADESFQSTAEQVGYDDVSYFYKVFKKKMGISASEMRRQLKRIL